MLTLPSANRRVVRPHPGQRSPPRAAVLHEAQTPVWPVVTFAGAVLLSMMLAFIAG